MKQNFKYAVSAFKAGETSSDQSLTDGLTESANKMASYGFRLVSSVYDSQRKLTFLFFERNRSDEED